MADQPIKRAPGRPKGTGLNGRIRVLTPDEVDRLLAAAAKYSPKYDFMAHLTYYLALRVSELVSLRVEDFNDAAHQVTIRAKKLGFTKTYDLPDRIWRKYKNWLKRRNPGNSPWVFPHRLYERDEHMTDDAAQGTFRHLFKLAGIEGRHSIHDLRHTTATEMAAAGDGIAQIAGWLRHRAIISSSRYIDYQHNKEHEAKMKSRFSARGQG